MHRIRTPFGFSSTAREVVAGVDLSGRRALVTGGGAGLGAETAKALAAAGAEVTLAVRRPEAAREVAAEIRAAGGVAHIAALDLADLDSIADCAASWRGPLHILVANAGIMALPTLERAATGCEMQFAVNFLGHFALMQGLRGALAAAGGARVAVLSSSANLIAPVIWDDPHFRFLPYDPFVAYGQSKTACALLAVEATRRWAAEGIRANACNPGAIATGLQKHTGGLKTPPELRKSVAQGAATATLLAASPLLEGVGGRYFEDCNEAAVVAARPTDFSGGVAPYAIEHGNAHRLWALAEDLLGL